MGSSEHVHDLPIAVAADESLHAPHDVAVKADLGYRCLALKPAGKTLSVALLMAEEARKRDLACFVADSACIPILVDWNKTFAARLPPFPGLDLGFMESNGAQNYTNWQAMLDDHPCNGASWIGAHDGIFTLPDAFFARSGGIFDA